MWIKWAWHGAFPHIKPRICSGSLQSRNLYPSKNRTCTVSTDLIVIIIIMFPGNTWVLKLERWKSCLQKSCSGCPGYHQYPQNPYRLLVSNCLESIKSKKLATVMLCSKLWPAFDFFVGKGLLWERIKTKVTVISCSYLSLQADKDPILREWLKRKLYVYTSGEIQNEIIRQWVFHFCVIFQLNFSSLLILP